MSYKFVGAMIVLLVVLAIVGFFSMINRGQCWWYGYQTERETRYAAFVGCMVKVDNAWFPRHELRVSQ